jgi:hypothetical protein
VVAGQEDPSKKKKGFFGKIAGIFKDDKEKSSSSPSNQQQGQPSDEGNNPH